MYEHYEPSERVFVDREEYLEWMEDALGRCKRKSVVLHLRGIGGIGKSSLVEHWMGSIENGIVLDLSRVGELYDRLDVLAKGAARIGIPLSRFDVLWHIRQRFVMGVEPSKEEGRGWVLDILSPIDVIIPITSVSRAIKKIGEKLKPILDTTPVSDLGSWLRTRLGKEYTEKLLEVLWKEPSHAEFLYLDALVEDLNNREDIECPLLVMLDGFEVVDTENLRWRYGKRNISESELWYIFLSSLKNCVGVVASRQPPPPKIARKKVAEESEMTELDEESCRELLDKRGIASKDLQTKIITVSGGNPFVINCLCDIHDSRPLSIADVASLGADTLEQVRVKTWRRLFRETEGLLDIIDCAGLVPYIDRRVMDIIAPSIKSEQWDRLTRLSFVRDLGDGTWVLHDLARELVLAELGEKLGPLTDEVADSLEAAAAEQSDTILSGMALSVRALAAEPEVIATIEDVVEEFTTSNQHKNAISLLGSVTLSTDEGKAVLQRLRGTVYAEIDRVGDAEGSFRGGVRLYRELAKTAKTPESHLSGLAGTLNRHGVLLQKLDRPSEAEEAHQEALGIYREFTDEGRNIYRKDLSDTLIHLAELRLKGHREEEAEELVQEALELCRELAKEAANPDVHLHGIARTLRISQWLLLRLDRTSEADAAVREALRIYRELAEKAPDLYLKNVAGALWERYYVARGRLRFREAEDASREALRIYRELAEKAPDLFLPNVAWLLSSLGFLLHNTYRRSEAHSVLQEAVEIFRDLAEKIPDAYSDDYATTLATYGCVLRETGELTESEDVFQKAIDILEELARKAPEVYSRGKCKSQQLGKTLRNFGRLQWTKGRMSQAEELCREALDLHRELTEKMPHRVHTLTLSCALHDHAIMLRRVNRVLEAEMELREALEVFRRFSNRGSDAYSSRSGYLASALNNLALILWSTNRVSEADEALREALQVFRGLSEKLPEMFLPHVATTLTNLGILLRKSGKTSESEEAFREVLEIRESLPDIAPEISLPCAASALNNLGIILYETNRADEAEEAFQEGLGLSRELAKLAPEVYLTSVASLHNNLGVLLRKTNELSKAEQAYREALRILEELVEKAPDVYHLNLTSTLSNLYVLLEATGRNQTAAKRVMTRLQKLGIKSVPEDERWLEENEEQAIWMHGLYVS